MDSVFLASGFDKLCDDTDSESLKVSGSMAENDDVDIFQS